MWGNVVTLGGVVDVIPPVTALTVVVLDIIFGVVMVVVAVIIGEIWLQLMGDVRLASLASWVPTPKASNDLQSTRLNKNIGNFLGI